jgi:hypothetical protein
MRQRKFEIVINEELKRDDGVGAVVSMRAGSSEEGYNVVDYKYEVAELTEDQIVEAVNKLMYYVLPTIPAKDVEAHKTGTVFKRTSDGKFVPT